MLSTGMAGRDEGCWFGQQVGMIGFFLPAQTLYWVVVLVHRDWSVSPEVGSEQDSSVGKVLVSQV